MIVTRGLGRGGQGSLVVGGLSRRTLAAITGQIMVRIGSSWLAKPVKVWNGTLFVRKPLKFWNGSMWEETPY